MKSGEFRGRLVAVGEEIRGRGRGSQGWFARLLGVREATVSAWCRGEVVVPGYAERMLKVLEGEAARLRYWRAF